MCDSIDTDEITMREGVIDGREREPGEGENKAPIYHPVQIQTKGRESIIKYCRRDKLRVYYLSV